MVNSTTMTRICARELYYIQAEVPYFGRKEAAIKLLRKQIKEKQYKCDSDELTGFSFVIFHPVQTTKWLSVLGSEKTKHIKSFLHNCFRNDREVRRYKSHHSLWRMKIFFTLRQGIDWQKITLQLIGMQFYGFLIFLH